MAVADSYDAMTSDRPYRRGMAVAKAAAILREGRGRQWDAQVVDTFLRTIAADLEPLARPLLHLVPAPERAAPDGAVHATA
jgi:HD-GYP domain-containing protein (c-di-GMP phosphodiesterase class II)